MGREFEAPGTAMMACGDWLAHSLIDNPTGRDGSVFR